MLYLPSSVGKRRFLERLAASLGAGSSCRLPQLEKQGYPFEAAATQRDLNPEFDAQKHY